jgi:hypothetical protein
MTRKSAKTSPITEMRRKARKFNFGLSGMVLLRFGCLLSVIGMLTTAKRVYWLTL